MKKIIILFCFFVASVAFAKSPEEMPTGNEFGANSQWIPGGKLPTGLNEVVIKTEGKQLNVNYFVKDL
jgi:hypothetical protein